MQHSGTILKGIAMTHNDDDDRMERFEAEPNDIRDNDQYSLWRENKKMKLGTNLSESSEKIDLTKFGIGFLILLILLLSLYARNKIVKLEKRVYALENRVKSVEEKGQKLDAMGYGMAKIEEQSQSIEQLKARLDRSEKALTSRMDQISKDFKKFKQPMHAAESQKETALKTTKVTKTTAKNRYHIVKTGETLYTIGRRYGVTVKELKKINKLSDKSVIRPGQKLLIKP
jgi:LysM repeat protein